MNRANLISKSTYGVIILLLFLVPLFTGIYWLHVLITAGIAVILTVSLRLIFNMGQLSFGQAGMMTFGAYTAALLSTKLGIPSWLALAAAPLAAGLLALAVGYPFMRLKGVYFSLCTIFFSVILQLIAEQWQSVTGGSFGINRIPPLGPLVIGGLTVDFTSKITYYYFMLILVLVVLIICYALEKSRLGLTWFSIKESEELSQSVGINNTNYKVLAFCIGSMFAGLAGGLYAQYNSVITPGAFGFSYAVFILLYMAVGGAKRFAGPILGAFVLILIPEIARPLKQYQPYLFAGVTILVIFLLPDGLISLPQRLISLVRERRRHA